MPEEVRLLAQFNFFADFGDGCGLGFQDLSGLEMETAEGIEYRHPNRPTFGTIELPGIGKYRRVTLNRGVLSGAGGFRRWLAAIRQGRIERRTVTIRLFDEQGRVAVMSWTLANAWPAAISDGALASDAEEVAVEALELAYEAITAADG